MASEWKSTAIQKCFQLLVRYCFSLIAFEIYLSLGFRSLSICLDVDIFGVTVRFYSAFKICSILSFTMFGMFLSIISSSTFAAPSSFSFTYGIPVT